jgi:hypothetical protein
MRARLGAVALLALFTVRGPARADYEETELRLKSAGVADKLRAKVHKAIDRCVAYLVKQQLPKGTFEPKSNVTGITLLSALALRHAGTAPTEAPVARAVAFLFDGKAPDVDTKSLSAYEAGLALMLLHAIGRFQPEAPRIASALVRGLDSATAWWGYDTPGPADEGGTAVPGGFATRDPNLSTTQFAALGLWAARRMGIAIHPSAWRLHAQSLIDSQGDTGSWPYAVKREGGALRSEDSRKGYFTGTCMGLANLLLVRQALKADQPTDPLLARLDPAIAASLTSLRADAPVFLEDPAAGDLQHLNAPTQLPGPRLGPEDVPGIGAFYTLYALEKACLFADVEAIVPSERPGAGDKKPAKGKGPKVYWYAATAEWLLSVQNQDGGWATAADKASNVVDSALALLILVRSPSTSHPTTPREVDAKPRGPVTPGDPAPPPDKGR